MEDTQAVDFDDSPKLRRALLERATKLIRYYSLSASYYISSSCRAPPPTTPVRPVRRFAPPCDKWKMRHYGIESGPRDGEACRRPRSVPWRFRWKSSNCSDSSRGSRIRRAASRGTLWRFITSRATNSRSGQDGAQPRLLRARCGRCRPHTGAAICTRDFLIVCGLWPVWRDCHLCLMNTPRSGVHSFYFIRRR